MIAFGTFNGMNETVIRSQAEKGRLHQRLLAQTSVNLDTYNQDVLSIQLQEINHLFKFVFFRHPFERLVSTYADKFVNSQSKSFMQPVVNFHRKKNPDQSIKYMSFKLFIEYVVYEVSTNHGYTSGSLHWWPATKLCKLCQVQYDFYGRIETIHDDVACIASKFPDYVELQSVQNLISTKINTGRKSESLSKQYFSQLSKETVLELYEVFKDDFIIGGYEYPSDYLSFALSK